VARPNCIIALIFPLKRIIACCKSIVKCCFLLWFCSKFRIGHYFFNQNESNPSIISATCLFLMFHFGLSGAVYFFLKVCSDCMEMGVKNCWLYSSEFKNCVCVLCAHTHHNYNDRVLWFSSLLAVLTDAVYLLPQIHNKYNTLGQKRLAPLLEYCGGV
jgi:hypothetical protein